MNIINVIIENLYGIFEHRIDMNQQERITIVHGPNGTGKTTVLRVIHSLFNSKYSDLFNVKFSSFTVMFDDESYIKVLRGEKTSSIDADPNISIYYGHAQKKKKFTLKYKDIIGRENDGQFSDVERLIPFLRRVAFNRWEDMTSGERLGFKDVMEQYGHLLPSNIAVPEDFKLIIKAFKVHFIQTNRLLHWKHKSLELAVDQYSKELVKTVQDRLKKSASESQRLDRTFPIRLIKKKFNANLTVSDIIEELRELEEKRSRLMKAGLYDQNNYSLLRDLDGIHEIDESAKTVLSEYVKDMKEKLSHFDEVLIKIETLTEIVNKRFRYKEMSFNMDEGFVFNATHDRSPLSAADLSSGEQHELVLLYELLFNVTPNSLILIDEPEISLHVFWQKQFLVDLQRIMQLSKFSALIATHSPQIISDRWDLTVTLK